MATVSKESIEAKIKSVYYFNGADAVKSGFANPSAIPEDDLANLSLVTYCTIILENGFKVEGVSACVDPAIYDEWVGRRYAYENAFNKIWELEGYLLRQALHEKEETAKALASFAENNTCDGGGCTI
ncbi:hypothetical protein PP764_gp17 [Escherichia phage phi G17]|uniref:Phage protein n=1 Tax=Escherichia phage phi G17 TaxID=2234086 RepID=A0A2Z4Q015_9CAUD|nr:hypothetical protein PP764_gp17 [Escherichia phage phi G17]AWY03383.1 hypothetical protein [Escherichia phage phi G17]